MGRKSIEILRVTHLRGPNMWTYEPVLEVVVDIGELEEYPSNRIPGFPERLAGMIPSLIEHRCSYEERGGFLRRLKEGTWPGHILEHVTLELLSLAGMAAGFGRARETSTRGVYKVVVSAAQEEVTFGALTRARDLILAAMESRPYDVTGAVTAVRELIDEHWLGPSTASIVEAAEDRRIPAIRLNDGNLVQLGHGARQRRIWTAESDRTSAIAEGVSSDKDLTKRLLADCGVPVPAGRLVERVEDAWEAALEVGLPVVVKPSDANHGRGVFIDLDTREQVETAFPIALEEGSSVIVERYVPGDEHRLLIVGGRLVAAARGEPAWVIGDGRASIAELIESQLNANPLRGDTDDCPLHLVRIDSPTRLELERQGCTPESVPPAGERVLIQRKGNAAIDVTRLVHPSVAEHAALAARIVGLDIAGIDLLAEDISRPLEDQGGAIVEVNAGPGLHVHLRPANGPALPVGRAIVDYMMPGDENGRIPIFGITGSRGTTPVARLLSHLLRQDDRCVGTACRDGLYVGARRIAAVDSADWAGAHRVLINRLVDTAVLENGPYSMVSEGLAYDRCLVGIVMDIDPTDTIPEFDILDAESFFKVIRSQVDVVLQEGAAVLNAADPRVLALADLCDGDVVLFAPDRALPGVVAHLGRGGRAVVSHDGAVLLVHGEEETVLVDRLPEPFRGEAGPAAPASLLAAVAAAWSAGMSLDLIRAGLATYGTARATATPVALV